MNKVIMNLSSQYVKRWLISIVTLHAHAELKGSNYIEKKYISDNGLVKGIISISKSNGYGNSLISLLPKYS